MAVNGRAGAYRLVEHIASGGMGVVYLAERDDGQVRHQAAVKILRRGLDAEDQVKRFMSERQILAQLEHPNIARLLDAGVTDDHRPYFVMEYVQGEHIDAYCDGRGLGVRERVALIRDVALAVDYAHRNLVVHRDLKPSNILVTADAQVKLLDFGVAKLLDVDPEATTMTGPGVRLMTPGYASPEQVTGDRITTATDVYVLGLLLYELLTGGRAQNTDGLALAEIEELVVHGDVPRPSDAATLQTRAEKAAGRGAPDPAEVARARGTTPGRLRSLLRGDLDRIVAVALRKEPERRYPSAQAMADDLQRFLDGEPIQARRDSAVYRVGKFVRRRWPMVAAAAVFLAMLVIYAVTVSIQARQIARERDRARASQAQAEAVTAYLVQMFQASDPSEARGDTLTARELLDAGVKRVEELGAQPEVQAQLLDVMGRVYQSLGRFEQAHDLLARSLQVRRRVHGEVHGGVAEAWTHLGDLSSMRGRYDEAEAQLRKALAIHEVTHGRESAESATDLHQLGAVLVDKGDREQGKALFEEALAIRRRVLPPDHLDIAESLSGLAYAAASVGDFAEMERRHAEALALLRQKLPSPHPRLALGLNNLAAAVESRGRYDEAARLHREALAMRRVLFGDEHPAVANSLNNLTTTFIRQGKLDDAEPLAREVIAIRKRLLGPGHPSTGTALNNLAVLLFRAGRPADAVPVMQEARTAARTRLAEDHPLVLTIDASLATMIAAQGKDREAEDLFKTTLARGVATLGPDHPDVTACRFGYGRFLAERRRFAEAEPLMARSYELRRKQLGPKHPDTARTGRELAALYRSTGDAARADEIERALQ